MTFEENTRRVLAETGITLASDGTLSLDATYTGPGQPTQAQIDLFNERQRSGAAPSEVDLLWARDLRHKVERILTGDSTDPDALISVFFLRLHGWLADFPKNNAIVFQTLEELGPKNHTLRCFAAVRDALEAIRTTLTEDELLYVEYRRDIEGHMHAGNYEPQWNKKRSVVKDRIMSSCVGKEYDRRDAAARIRGVCRRYRLELRVVQGIALRIAPHVRTLEAAMIVYNTPHYD